MPERKHLIEIAIYAAILIGGTAFLMFFDGFEQMHRFVETHEAYEIDELLLAVPLLLICLIIYSYRRSQELAERNRELVKTSKRLQAAYDQINNLSESRKKFMAIACHELKAPLSNVTAALDLARQTKSKEEAEEMLDHVRSNLDNLQLLISDVLLFTSLSHDVSLTNRDTFSIRDTLESVIRITGHQSRAKGLSLHLTIDSKVPERAVGIEGWIRMICLNLVGNAIKYTPTGSITLHCSFRKSPRPELVLKVSDTGVGIPEEKQDLIFEPYEQVTISDWKKREGLGLGLSVVKELVKRLDGSISLESKVDKGSTFTVVLPVELQ